MRKVALIWKKGIKKIKKQRPSFKNRLTSLRKKPKITSLKCQNKASNCRTSIKSWKHKRRNTLN